MTISTQRFIHKPVDAIRVTNENIEQVATWVQGVLTDSYLPPFSNKYIELTVNHPTGRRTAKAFAGDWIVSVKGSFKVYNHRAFTETFSILSEENELQQYNIHKLVDEVVRFALNTVVDARDVGEEKAVRIQSEIEETTRKILDLL